jgi:hypothetical protein
MNNEKKVPLFDNLSDEQKTVSIPYYVHEGEMFRVERLNKRWFIAFMIVLFMLFGTNLGWVIYENQFETYSYEIQQDYYNAQVKLVGEKEALKTVSKPGCSEQQTGYSIDFSDNNSGENPRTMDFANTDAYRWLCEHAHEYGFILRYPAGKEEITSNSYEPWHFRYVGVEAATYIMEHNLTLEEFVALYKDDVAGADTTALAGDSYAADDIAEAEDADTTGDAAETDDTDVNVQDSVS